MDRDELVARVADEIYRLRINNRTVTSRSLARAALAIIEPCVREECARTVDAWEISAGVEGEARTARGIAAAIRAGAKP